MRILFLCHNHQGVGTYVRAYELARNLVPLGHDVTLVAVSPDSRTKTRVVRESGLSLVLTANLGHGGAVMSRLSSSRGWGILDLWERLRLVQTERFDIVQLFDHFPNITIPSRRCAGRSGTKLVSDWCDVFHLPGGFRDTFKYRLDGVYRRVGFLPRWYLRAMEVKLRKRADAVIVISSRLRRLGMRYGIDADKMTVLHGGVDVEMIRPLPKTECRKTIGLPVDGKIILFLGRSQFDLEILITSFARLKRRVPDAHLVVVGSNLYEWPRKLAFQLGLGDGYRETGYCPAEQLPTMLACADAFALPMKDNLINQTRWPNKVGEYLATGRPVVASRVGDIGDLLQDYEAGLTVDNTTDDFSEQLERVLTDRAKADELGRNARRLACEQLSWAGLAQSLERVYLRVLGGTSKSDHSRSHP